MVLPRPDITGERGMNFGNQLAEASYSTFGGSHGILSYSLDCEYVFDRRDVSRPPRYV